MHELTPTDHALTITIWYMALAVAVGSMVGYDIIATIRKRISPEKLIGHGIAVLFVTGLWLGIAPSIFHAPPCPGTAEHVEVKVPFTYTPDEVSTIMTAAGWTHVTQTQRSSGGLFGGFDDFVTATCGR